MYRQAVSRLVSILCVALAIGACAVDQEEPAGTVELDLVGQGPTGTLYVLRNAEITVTEQSSGDTRVFRTEDDVNATRFSAHVVTGDYTVRLSPGWRLDRRTNGVDERVAAALTSPNPSSFTVSAGATTRVALRFTVGGDGVVLDAGDFDIEVEIDEPAFGTIGNRQHFGLSQYWSPGYVYGQRFDLPGAATALRFGHLGDNYGAQCRFAVYRDNVDAPGALVASTGVVTLGSGEVDLTPTTLTIGRYWLTAACNGYPVFGTSSSQLVPTISAPMSAYDSPPASFPRYERFQAGALNLYLIVDYQ